MPSLPNSFYQNSDATRPALRIGLLLDRRDQIPAFVRRIIEDIEGSNFARVECLIVREPEGRRAPDGDPERRKEFLYRLYLRLDARMRPPDAPLANVDSRDLLSTIDTIAVELSGNRFSADDVEKIRAKNLDVLVQFGFNNVLHGDILKAARYGVWSYQHGDPEFYRGGPSHFWELRESSPLSGVALRVLSEQPDGGPVLCKSLFATERTLSVSRNRYIPYWGSSDLIIRKLHELHRFGWDYVLEKAMPSAPYRGKRLTYSTPTNRDMFPWLGKIFLKKALAYPFRKRMVQHWRIAIRVNGPSLLDSDSKSDMAGFRWIDAPLGHFWADPFVFEHEGKYWVFFEDYSYAQARGSIFCAEISPQGELGEPRICLDDASHHYSYPHIFRAGTEIFMVPESYDSNRVDLFRCRRFPDQWEREATLMEGKFVDTTIWEHEDLWWLATTSADPTPGTGSLLLFYSASLAGEWHFHPANPISTDIRESRCAGRVFRDGDRLIRPSQSGAPDYGYSITFHEIMQLTRQQYSERPLKTITPDHWTGVAGVHTYNRAGNIEFIDGRSPMALKRVQMQNR